jgi:hypothetical protein
VEGVSGVAIKPQMVPTDESQINEQVDRAIKFIDSQIAIDNPQKAIDRSGTPKSQEQRDSHTLTVNDAYTPFKT